MTEAEWLACTDPDPMLPFLRGKVTDRKLRLFACGCCRRIGQLLTPVARTAVEVAERFADGLATPVEREAAWRCCRDTVVGPAGDFLAPDGSLRWSIADAAWYNRSGKAGTQGQENDVFPEPYARAFQEAHVTWQSETREQAGLLRDIVGNPFHPVLLDPSWLRWDHAAVAKLAQAIYEEGRFGDLPRLADALEEAGCTDCDVLNHARQPSEHVRGCWVVDLLLGKM